jgi:hypothetical protein
MSIGQTLTEEGPMTRRDHQPHPQENSGSHAPPYTRPHTGCASINTGHFPTPFKTTTTVIIRKPTKPDYTKPNAYCPIALENTMGKIIESIMAEMLSYIAETHQLLPPKHYGGCPGRTGEEVMMMLSEKIMNAWKEKDVYSAVFMDVAGAFNNVHHKRLLHNLKKRRIPGFMVKWIGNFL